MIDVRCGAQEPASRHRNTLTRCQLAAGHEGVHAVMFCRAGTRMMRTWTTDGSPHEHVAAQENRPWAPGMPIPAWDEALLQSVDPVPATTDARAGSASKISRAS